MSALVDVLCAGADFMHFAASESAALQPTDRPTGRCGPSASRRFSGTTLTARIPMLRAKLGRAMATRSMALMRPGAVEIP